MKKQTLLTLAMLAIATLGIRETQAAVLFEAGGDIPGNEGWTISDSGDGVGTQSAPTGVGSFLGSGVSEDAWGLTSNADDSGSNFLYRANRDFGETLDAGEFVEISFRYTSNGSPNDGGFAIGLTRPGDSGTFSARLAINNGSANYRFFVNGGDNFQSTVDSVDNADRLFRFTVVDNTTFRLEVEDSSGVDLFTPYEVTVPDITISGNEIIGVTAQVTSSTGVGLPDDSLLFNKVTLIPEPTSAALLLGSFGLLMLRRRQK